MAEGGSDAKAALVQGLRRVAGHLKEGQYKACVGVMNEMTHFSCLLGQKDWVFACEVLESVFLNMHHLSIGGAALPGPAEKSIRARLAQCVDDVLLAIESGDDSRAIPPLKQARFATTELQYRTWSANPAISEGAP